MKEKLTLFVIANEANLANGGMRSKKRNIATNLNLRRFINDKGLDWCSSETTSSAKGKTGEHREGAKYNRTVLEVLLK